MVPLRSHPDVLVLGAGGTLGIAWLRGVLEGLREAAGIDWTESDYFVGTSAGAVVAATLAARKPLRPPDSVPDAAAAASDTGELELPADDQDQDGAMSVFGRAVRAAGAWASAVAAPAAPLALKAAAPGGAVVRAGMLKALSRDAREVPAVRRYIESLDVEFDGRLRVAAVDKRTGRRVMFGRPGSPPARVSEAVAASCAVPWLFSPVQIDGREYVDGGVWSPTNLDAAPAGRGARVLCFMPTGTPATRGSAIGALRAATHAAALTEMSALRARGARVRVIAPDADAGAAMGVDLMDGSRREQAFAAGLVQGRRLAGA